MKLFKINQKRDREVFCSWTLRVECGRWCKELASSAPNMFVTYSHFHSFFVQTWNRFEVHRFCHVLSSAVFLHGQLVSEHWHWISSSIWHIVCRLVNLPDRTGKTLQMQPHNKNKNSSRISFKVLNIRANYEQGLTSASHDRHDIFPGFHNKMNFLNFLVF